MRLHFIAALLLLTLAACSRDAENLAAARTSLANYELDKAERQVALVDGAEAQATRKQIAALRARRSEVAAVIAATVERVGSHEPDELRASIEALGHGDRDPEVLRSVDEGVKRLAEYAAKYGVKHDPNGARVSAARQQLDAVRGELDKALREQRWFEAGKLLAPFADAPPETAGELNVLRRKLELQSRADAESTQRRALEFERDRGARFADEWLQEQLPRFAELALADELRTVAAQIRERTAHDPAARPDSASTARAGADVGGGTRRAAPAPQVIPKDVSADQLAQMARDAVLRDDLSFAQKCWMRACGKFEPGDMRDDCIGEAGDLRSRMELRDEVIEAFTARPEVFRNLGVELVDAVGFTQQGALTPWPKLSLDVLQRVVALLDLSQVARRGVICETLRGADDSERERAFEQLAEMVARGDIAGVDAANIVDRARGGLGATERHLLEKGRWVTRAATATAERAVDEALLVRAFLAADELQRDDAFRALSRGASEVTTQRVLHQRLTAALQDVQRGRTLVQLTALGELRKELDDARTAALKLIFDERIYFYPYAPPEPPNTAGDYAKAQHRVDELVSAVREIWARSKPIKVAKDFRAAADELTWCEATYRELGLEFTWPATIASYALVQDPALDEIDLASFAWNAAEAQALAYDRSVNELNERVWSALAKTKTDPPAMLPSSAEMDQVRITNRYRTLMGRCALAWNPKIQVAAQGHSEYMANTGDFGHFEKGDPARYSPFDRMKLAGYTGGVSENCAMVGGDPQAAHAGWLHSSGHHRNILMPGHREMASAVAANYWTQNFGEDTSFKKDLVH